MFEKLLAKQHIQNLDLSSVCASAVEKLGWSPEKAQQVEQNYRRFLYALAHRKKDDVLSPPSQEVDDFWHQHILDTRKYREDCHTVFGHYIDHTPGLPPEDQRKADMRRQQVYDDYGIDAISFAKHKPRESIDDSGGFVSCGGSSSDDSGHHGHHSSADHSGHGSSSHGDGGGHGGSSGGDSGGGDSGGGDGGGGGSGCGGGGSCGGGGCGGGGCGGG